MCILFSLNNRMDKEDVMLSEINETQKDKYCVFALTCGIQGSQIYGSR